MKTLTKFTFLLVLFLGISGCWSNANSDSVIEEEETTTNDDEDDVSVKINDEEVSISGIKNALKDIEKSLSDSEDGEPVEVVNFRELKKLLPERLIGMERTSHTGEKSGGLGFKFSVARAKYEDEDKRLKVEITDTGGMGLAKLGMAAFAAIEIDKETDDGYERTYQEDDISYFEEYDGTRKYGALKAFVGERFVVNIEGDELEMKDFKRAIKKLGITKLKKM